MNKRHPQNNIIERKLEQLPAADVDLLWNDMHTILDKKMPQKEERRRFAWWVFSDKGLLLMTIGLFIMTTSFLFFLSEKKNSQIAIKNLTPSQQTIKFNEDALAKNSQSNKENIVLINEPNEETTDNISKTISSAIALKEVSNNRFNTPQIVEKITDQSKNYITNDQFDQPTNTVAGSRENSAVDLANFNSIHHDLHITPNRNKQKFSLTQPLNTNKQRNNEKGFYAGIMIGSDISSVDFQPAKAGATTGFILGYALNEKWSIESGFLWDTKRVYDNGTYFNPPGYTPTNGIKITAVNGKSRLQEWPVNIKYSLKSKDHSFFATTGVSSYFMKLENYDYEYTQNNQPGGHNYLSYKNGTKDWFGVVNFSMGYSHKIGNTGNIRIEPYFKLPIKNIGTANMPISSTGLNIGFTKTLKR